MLKPLSGIAGMVVIMSLAACTSGTKAEPEDPGSGATPSSGISQLVSPAPVSTSSSYVVVSEPPTEQMDAIRADLEARGVTGSELTLVEARKITWNNGALGCPQPGAQYTQALVDGWWILVKVGDTTYDYRFGDGSSPMLCENGGTFEFIADS